MNIIAIDPGVDGGIVVMRKSGEIVQKYVMPKVAKVFDLNEFIHIIKSHKDNSIAYIEDVHSLFGMSAKSNFSFGGIVWTMRAVCACFNVPYTLVAPKTWQKEMFQGVREMRKPSKQIKKKDKKTGEIIETSKQGQVDTKAMALLAVKRLYPDTKLTATDRSTIAHDGIVDAILIARYGCYKERG